MHAEILKVSAKSTISGEVRWFFLGVSESDTEDIRKFPAFVVTDFLESTLANTPKQNALCQIT